MLYTSIHPALKRQLEGHEVGKAYLDECISSWSNAGFTICSLNHPDEIPDLQARYPQVVFRPLQAIKPRIVDFLDAIRDGDDDLVGIFNCDCLFTGSPGIARELRKSSRSHLVILERINFSARDLRPTSHSCFGFDAFLFSKENVRSIEMDRDIRIGETWWDFMFPLSYAACGGEIKQSPYPLLYHLDHTVAWTKEQWREAGGKTYQSLRHVLHYDAPIGDDTDLYIYSFHCFDWLRACETLILGVPQIGSRMRSELDASHASSVEENRQVDVQRMIGNELRKEEEEDRLRKEQEEIALRKRLDGPANRLLGEFICTVSQVFINVSRVLKSTSEKIFKIGDDLQFRASYRSDHNPK